MKNNEKQSQHYIILPLLFIILLLFLLLFFLLFYYCFISDYYFTIVVTIISYYCRYNILFVNYFNFFRYRCQSCENLPSPILDLCAVIRLTIVFKNLNCLCIKRACLANTMQQGRLFQHYYAHYLSYYSNYFDSLLRI
jgi:hypothetical protein